MTSWLSAVDFTDHAIMMDVRVFVKPRSRSWRHFPFAVLVVACIVSISDGWVLPRPGVIRGERKRIADRQQIRFAADQVMLCANPRILEQIHNTSYTVPSDGQDAAGMKHLIGTVHEVFFAIPTRTILFSSLMGASGAILGPFLDSYHSLFGVLQYDAPISAVLWGDSQHPALITTDWVPVLFGLAGFLIGWMYILFDAYFAKATSSSTTNNIVNKMSSPSPTKILLGIALFTFQYWWSGVLYLAGVDRSVILSLMTLSAACGFYWLDNSRAGFITSCATAMGGPLIEVVLLTLSRSGLLFDDKGYHYNDLGETGYFPLWIVPVYFLGGPANGNLARGFWQLLTSSSFPRTESDPSNPTSTSCVSCNNSRCVPCPNCDGIGNYKAMGDRYVECKACHGRGFVVCRACFDEYTEDPNDLEAIRDLMSRMPD